MSYAAQLHRCHHRCLRGLNGGMDDEKKLKRERRKQANRESATRSRSRKQAEVEELRRRYESLHVENTALKTELNQLKGDSEKSRLENAALMDMLKNVQEERQEGLVTAKTEAGLALPNSSENILNNSDTVIGNVHRECETQENSNSATKHHLLTTSSWVDPG